METQAFDLSVSTYGEVRQHEYEVVILPWGATEPHNLHLPYWTDSILAHDISVAAAKKAYDDDGVLAMVMPPAAIHVSEWFTNTPRPIFICRAKSICTGGIR